MTQADVELVRRMLDRFHEGDAPGALAHFADDVLVDASVRPDGGIGRGQGHLSRLIGDWVSAFESWEEEITSMESVGDCVLVCAVQRGIGKGSGAEIEQVYWTSYRVSGDLITAMKLHLDEADARANHV